MLLHEPICLFFFHLVHVIFRIIIIKLFRCSRISHERSKKENNLHHVFFTHRAHFFLTLNTFFSYYLFVRPFRFLHTKRKGRKRESFCVAFFPLVRRKKIIAKSIITCFSLGMYSITSDDSSIQPTFVTRFYRKGTLRVVRKSFCHYFHIFSGMSKILRKSFNSNVNCQFLHLKWTFFPMVFWSFGIGERMKEAIYAKMSEKIANYVVE